MCHWLGCELIFQLNFPSKTILCNLIEFSIIKILKTLGLKISKSSSINLANWGLPNNTKIVPFFFNFYFKFECNYYEIFVQYSITSPLNVKTLCNQLNALVFIKGFPKVPKAWQGVLWFGRFQYDKTNKWPFLINRYRFYLHLLYPNFQYHEISIKFVRKSKNNISVQNLWDSK